MPQSITKVSKVSIVPLLWRNSQLEQNLPFDLGNGLSIENMSSLIQSDLHSTVEEYQREEQKKFKDWSVCWVHRYEGSYSDSGRKSLTLLWYVLAHLRLIVPHKTNLGHHLQARLENARLVAEHSSWTLDTIWLEDCERASSIEIKMEHLEKLKSWLPWVIKFQASWEDFYPLYISVYWSEKAYLEEDPKIRHLLRVMALEALVSSEKDYGKISLFLPRLKKLLDAGTDLYEQYRCDLEPDLPKLILNDVVEDVWKLRHKIAHGDKIPSDWISQRTRGGTRRTLTYADTLGEASASMVALAWRKIIDSGLQATFANKSRMEKY